jgi:hypothetical protein
VLYTTCRNGLLHTDVPNNVLFTRVYSHLSLMLRCTLPYNFWATTERVWSGITLRIVQPEIVCIHPGGDMHHKDYVALKCMQHQGLRSVCFSPSNGIVILYVWRAPGVHACVMVCYMGIFLLWSNLCWQHTNVCIKIGTYLWEVYYMYNFKINTKYVLQTKKMQ